MIFSLINPTVARSQGVLQEIEQTGVLKVGIRIAIKRPINTITDILTKLAGGTSPFIGVTISAADKCSGL
ncbi:MAG: hypothetical protein WBA93_31195 [Microcoleaceae cyanobacterium]